MATDEFLTEYEQNPFMQPPIPNLHPAILRDAIHELRGASYKSNKGLLLGTNLDNFSYRLDPQRLHVRGAEGEEVLADADTCSDREAEPEILEEPLRK